MRIFQDAFETRKLSSLISDFSVFMTVRLNINGPCNIEGFCAYLSLVVLIKFVLIKSRLLLI